MIFPFGRVTLIGCLHGDVGVVTVVGMRKWLVQTESRIEDGKVNDLGGFIAIGFVSVANPDSHSLVLPSENIDVLSTEGAGESFMVRYSNTEEKDGVG